MGSPQNPTAEQFKQLEASGHLEKLTGTQKLKGAEVDFTLPRQSVSLIQIHW